MRLLSAFIASLCVGSSLMSHAQSEVIRFENYGRKDGLAQATITGIHQSKNGYMWFSTAEGLHQFDGYQFTVYKKSNTPELSDNHLTALEEWSENNMCLGTYTGQLDILNAVTKQVQHVRLSLDSTLNNYPITALRRYGKNLLVATDGGGIFVVDSNLHAVEHFTQENSILPSNYVNCLEPERNDLGIWVGSTRGIVLFQNDGFKTFSSLKKFELQNVNHIHHTPDKMFIATHGQGLQIWDFNLDSVLVIPSPRIRGARFANFVTQDKDLNVWVGSEGAGLLMLTDNNFNMYRNDPYNGESLISDNVRKGFVDRQGILWLGCINGISKYDPNLKLFNVKSTFLYGDKPVNNNVYAMHSTRDGNIWLGTLSGGLSAFNPSTHDHVVYPIIQDGPLKTRAVRAIYEDSKGRLWIGTRDEGLFLFNRASKRFKHMQPPTSIRITSIRHIYEDPTGNLWLAGMWGLVSFNPETQTFKKHPSAYHKNNPIYQIYHDEKRDELILATFRSGLHIYNEKDSSFLVMRHNDDSLSPSADAMMCLLPIGKDSFLIGTYGGGLNIFDRKTLEFTTINSDKGLPNDVVYGIVEDKPYHYWLSTNEGLVYYNFLNGTFKSFGLKHYLQDLEFNEGAFGKSKDGVIFFGGIRGFNFFKSLPQKPLAQTDENMAITRVKIMNSEVPISWTRDDSKFELSYRENLISFEFSALDYSNTEDITYAYKMEGYDADWIYSGTRHTAYYTRLDPGTYTFRVRKAGTENAQEASLQVVVIPPYWKTWWFRILVGLVILSLVFLFIRNRTRSVKRQYENKMVDLELKALRSQMNPHFIFNSLNSIQYYVLNNEPKSAYTYLTKFSSLMRMILQNSRIKYITLAAELEWLKTYLELEKMRLEGELTYEIYCHENIDPDIYQLPSMLIQPYVENAIIHGLLPKADNRKISIRFQRYQSRLLCTIEDNGIGREKSAELNKSRTKKHKSQGIKVTGERLEVLTQDLKEKPKLSFTDLKDEKGNAAGTRVMLSLPILINKKPLNQPDE
jgi:ligand-binding sensor domain-containing protein